MSIKVDRKKRILKKIKMGYIPSILFAVAATMVVSALGHNDTTLSVWWITHEVLVRMLYVVDVLLVISIWPFVKIKEVRFNSWMLIIPVFAMLFLNLISPYNAARLGISSTALYILFCIAPREIQRRAFKVFRMIWTIVCAVGIIGYLCYILNIPVPYGEAPYYFGNAKMHYINYNFTFLYDSGRSLRLCGICNEPGYFGTFCALILCAGAVNLKKKGNWAILIAGLLSFSVAFIMVLTIYLLAKLLIKIKQEKDTKKRVLQFVGVLLAIVALFVILPNIQTGNQYIDRTLKRFSITSEGLAGDNRTSAKFDELYNSTPFYELLFGKGRGYSAANGVAYTSSYKVYVLEYGVIVCIIIWGTLIVAVLYRNTKYSGVVAFVIAFFASVYQRPNIITLPYIVLLVGGVEYIKSCVLCKNIRKPDVDMIGIDNRKKTLLDKLMKGIVNPEMRFLYLSRVGLLNRMRDEVYLKKKFKLVMGDELNLESPQTFNEKLQWLKINDRKKIYTTMVDKYEAKKYVADLIGEDYIIPTLGIYNKFDDIDFDKLPRQFVIKCTHDSGGLVICRDKTKLDKKAAKKKINKCLKRNYYYSNREWPYKDVRPRVIVEEYMEDKNSKSMRDYKFFCFNGEPELMYLSEGLENHKTAKISFYDMEMKLTDCKRRDYRQLDYTPKRPKNFEKMKEFSSILSSGIPHLRVDWYEINGKLYFGELTFTTCGGMVPFADKKWDRRLGNLVDLNLVKHKNGH